MNEMNRDSFYLLKTGYFFTQLIPIKEIRPEIILKDIIENKMLTQKEKSVRVPLLIVCVLDGMSYFSLYIKIE
jgi:hypothetical protein